MAYYGTVVGGNQYFSERLHSEAWTDATASDRVAALTDATRIIDSLNYKGVKHAVWSIMYEYNTSTEQFEKILTNPPTRNEIIAADGNQYLEFPRGQDSSVPEEIEWACYELALAFVEGFVPEDSIDRLNVVKQAYAAVGTTYDTSTNALEYLVYGIPTARVWRWLKPYLTDDRIIRLSRAD